MIVIGALIILALAWMWSRQRRETFKYGNPNRPPPPPSSGGVYMGDDVDAHKNFTQGGEYGDGNPQYKRVIVYQSPANVSFNDLMATKDNTLFKKVMGTAQVFYIDSKREAMQMVLRNGPRVNDYAVRQSKGEAPRFPDPQTWKMMWPFWAGMAYMVKRMGGVPPQYSRTRSLMTRALAKHGIRLIDDTQG